jgi:hypothetical protein
MKHSILLPVFALAAAFSPSLASGLEKKDRPSPCPYPGVEELRLQMNRGSAVIPEPIKRPKSPPIIGCERPFQYRGEIYAVDAPQAQDASTLRLFVKEVPEADRILQDYQNRRERSKISAYTGSIGLLSLILAQTVVRRLNIESKDSIKSIMQIGGLALTIGGFAYSFALLRTNESLLPKAVEAYNHAKPDDPVELKFEAGWSF